MTSWLHFCPGISISCNRLLDITRDFANRTLHQYKSDGVFVSWNLEKKSFTIIAKDSIDHNARSATTTKHYHGTSFSAFQFPSIAFPGDMISYPDDLPTATKSSNSKKVDSLLSSYTEPRRFLSPSTSLTFLTAPIPVLPDFDSVLHQQVVKEEYQWLESAYDDKTSYWIPRAKHHAGKYRSFVRLSDISAILPPIDEPVHTLSMQYNCMNIISNTINTLNPCQIQVDTADQPVLPLQRNWWFDFETNLVLINTSFICIPSRRKFGVNHLWPGSKR